MQKCCDLLSEFLRKHSVMLRDLQSLIGLLNFAYYVIVPRCAFLRQLIDLTKGIKCPTYHIHLTVDAKNDVLVWQQFLDSFNRKSFFLINVWETSTFKNYTLIQQALGGMALFLVRTGCMYVCMCVYVIGHSPSGLFRTNINK